MATGMIARRDLIIGAACVAAAAGANALKPHRLAPLLKTGSLADIVPAAFGDWRSDDIGDPLAINGPGTLSARLYNQLVTRVYRSSAAATEIMVLLAYGGQQTDELQLHRPEICYPAFGFTLVRNEPIDLPVAATVNIPARRLIAEGEDHRESIIYWSRIGEYLPASGGQQRKDRLEIALQGIIPDGLLSRFSTVTEDPKQAWQALELFIPALLGAVQPQYRKVLVGTSRGEAMKNVKI
jgi:EpsI family protein